MQIDRRAFLATGVAAAALPTIARARPDPDALGRLAREEVERYADRVYRWDEIPNAMVNPSRVGSNGKSFVSIINGMAKVEGGPIVGCITDLREAPKLLKAFVEGCYALRPWDAHTLVWRRLPALEEDQGRYRLGARLAWI